MKLDYRTMGNEIRLLTLQWLKRFLFPDFTNRLTWLVALSGIALATPSNEIFVYIINLVIIAANKNIFSESFLPPLSSNSDPTGYWLVIGALAHNVLHKLVSHRTDALLHQKELSKKERDKKLLDDFLIILPSNSDTLYLAKDHDFSTAFEIDAIKPIWLFIQKWDNAEFEFTDAAVETEKKNLLNQASDFAMKVSQYTSPTRGGMQCAIPSGMNPDLGLPEHIYEEIKILNRAAHDFYKAHQHFVRFARERS